MFQKMYLHMVVATRSAASRYFSLVREPNGSAAAAAAAAQPSWVENIVKANKEVAAIVGIGTIMTLITNSNMNTLESRMKSDTAASALRMAEVESRLKADAADRETRLKADAADREARLKADAAEREARVLKRLDEVLSRKSSWF